MALNAPYKQQVFMGVHAGDAAALGFIQAMKWDSTKDGMGTPETAMIYWDTALGVEKVYDGAVWQIFAAGAGVPSLAQVLVAGHSAGVNAIDMNAHQINGVAAGTVAGDALCYGQAGAFLSGLDLMSQRITSLAAPSASTDAATKGYVDQVVQGLAWQDEVIDRNIDVPPPLPGVGDRYIVGAFPIGLWIGHAQDITEWDGAAWIFTPERQGLATWVLSENTAYVWNGAAWVKLSALVLYTLDMVYDAGGAGLGRSITADSGAVDISVPLAINGTALSLHQLEATATANVLTIENLGASGASIGLTGTRRTILSDSADVSFGLTANDANPYVLRIAASNAGAGTAGIGITAKSDVTVESSSGKLTLRGYNVAGTAIDIDSTLAAGGIAIGCGALANQVAIGGGAGARNIYIGHTGAAALQLVSLQTMLQVTANDAIARTLTIASTNVGVGTAVLDIDADDAITIDSAAAGFSIDGVTTSNVSTTTGSLTLDSTAGKLYIGNGAGGTSITIGHLARTMGVNADVFTLTASGVNGGLSIKLDAAVAALRDLQIDAENSNALGARITLSDSWQKDSAGAGGYSVAMPFGTSAAEWTSFKTNFGDGTSLLAATNACSPTAIGLAGLTPGRVVIVGAGPTLADNANLSFNGTALDIIGKLTLSSMAVAYYPIAVVTGTLIFGDGGTTIVAGANDCTAMGLSALAGVTTGNGNTAVGKAAGYNSSTGTYNVFVGMEAGYGSGGAYTGADYNVCVGYRAGYALVADADSNTLVGASAGVVYAGDSLTAIGASACQLTTGAGNTALGYRAGYTCRTGVNNVLLGDEAANGSGAYDGTDNNVIIGYKADFDIAGGAIGNVIVGYQAAYNNRSGTYNVFIGMEAGNGTAGYTGADYNVCVGYRAGYLITADSDYNVLIGAQAGATFALDSAVAVGHQALQNTTGINNTALGFRTGQNCRTGTQNIFIGNSAGIGISGAYDNSDSNVVVGNGARYNIQGASDGGVAVGTSAGFNDQTGNYNVYVGMEAGYGSGGVYTGANYNVGVGYRAGYDLSTASLNNTLVGAYAGENITTGDGNVCIGYQAGSALTTENNKLYIANSNAGAGSVLITGDFSTGFVGIGVVPLVRLHVQNSDVARAPHASAYLLVESNSNALIEVMTSNSTYGGVVFSDSDANARGSVLYYHGTDILAFTAGAAEGLYLTSVRNLGIGTSTFGTNAAKVFAISSGTAPTAAHPADAIQMWAFDDADGSSAFNLRTESGTLYQLGTKTGLGTLTPTEYVSLNGQAARTLWMERNTTADTAGNDFSIRAGGATVGATSKGGGTLHLYPGVATGTRGSHVLLYGYPGIAAATDDNVAVDFLRVTGTGCYIGPVTATPSAYLHFKAGSANAGTAPIKLMTGPVLATQELGVFEYLTPTLYFTAAQRLAVPGTMYAMITEKNTNNSDVETILHDDTNAFGTRIIAAGGLNLIGKTVRISMAGFYGTDAADFGRLQIRVYLTKAGVDTLIMDTGIQDLTGGVAAAGWWLSALFTVKTIGDAGTVWAQGMFDLNLTATTAEHWDMVNAAIVAIDTNNDAQTVKVTSQFSIADAQNTITCTNFTIEILN